MRLSKTKEDIPRRFLVGFFFHFIRREAHGTALIWKEGQGGRFSALEGCVSEFVIRVVPALLFDETLFLAYGQRFFKLIVPYYSLKKDLNYLTLEPYFLKKDRRGEKTKK